VLVCRQAAVQSTVEGRALARKADQGCEAIPGKLFDVG